MLGFCLTKIYYILFGIGEGIWGYGGGVLFRILQQQKKENCMQWEFLLKRI